MIWFECFRRRINIILSYLIPILLITSLFVVVNVAISWQKSPLNEQFEFLVLAQLATICTHAGCGQKLCTYWYQIRILTVQICGWIYQIWRSQIRHFHNSAYHDDVINWKHFRLYWSFVQGIHWFSRWIAPTKASDAELWFFFHLRWTNGWANNRDAGDMRRHHAHYYVTVMICHGFTIVTFE